MVVVEAASKAGDLCALSDTRWSRPRYPHPAEVVDESVVQCRTWNRALVVLGTVVSHRTVAGLQFRPRVTT